MNAPTYKDVLEGPAPEGRLSEAVSRLIQILVSPDMARWRFRMGVALAITLVAKLFAVTSPMAFGEGINAITRSLTGAEASAGPAGVSAAIGFVLLYGVLRFAAAGVPQLRDAIFAPVSQDAQRITAVQGFAHVQSLSLGYHQTKRTGAVNRLIDRGANAIDFLLRFLVFNILPALVELVLAATLVAIFYGWIFSVVMVVAVLAYALVTWAMTEWRVKLRRVMNEADNEVNARSVDVMANFETVKAFAAEQRETDRFNEAKSQYADAASKSQQSLAALNAAQAAIMNGGLLAVALIGVWMAFNGQLEPGGIAALTLMLMQVYQPLNILGWAYREIKQASVDLERLFQTLNLRPEVEDKPDAPELAVKGGSVRFDHVSFAHDGRARSVDEVSFEIPAGAFVGLAGPSGAGKSTLLRLLFRFYDPDAGQVLIDGQDIAGVTQSSLRQNLGLVPQEVVLFNDTLRRNILYGRPEADEAALWDAVERARLKDFVEQLPDGLETRVGERGLKLSGGEKQRVGVARAILKDPPILILDEATSALDSQTESEVQAALAEAARGRTTIAVAHRLSTIARADLILVMEDGKLSEVGPHAQLVDAGGRYAAMWTKQAEAGAAA
jgi:ATP-binding cassette subfamily B protein